MRTSAGAAGRVGGSPSSVTVFMVVASWLGARGWRAIGSGGEMDWLLVPELAEYWCDAGVADLVAVRAELGGEGIAGG